MPSQQKTKREGIKRKIEFVQTLLKVIVGMLLGPLDLFCAW